MLPTARLLPVPMISKSCLDDLAVFGAPPAFVSPIHVGRPNLPDRQRLVAALDRILTRGILTNDGPEVRALEDRFREMTGAPEAVAVSNATLGLQLLAQALELKGKVLLPSFTFVATAHAFRWMGLRPVFCDIDPRTHNLDPDEVQRRLGSGISAVVGVHVWGRLCAPLELQRICRDRGIPLLFDAAHALGCSGHGRAAGAFGTAEVFSLHATKICHSFEGGIIVCRDRPLAEKLRRLRNFGFSGYDQVEHLGINAKLPEISAAAGLLSLDQLEQLRTVNTANAARYRLNLRPIPDLHWVMPEDGTISNHHYVVAEFGPSWPEAARDALVRALHAEGVLARRYFHPGVHRMQPYLREQPEAGKALRHTEALCRRVFCLPNGLAATADVIDRISEIVSLILTNLPAVAHRLQAGAD